MSDFLKKPDLALSLVGLLSGVVVLEVLDTFFMLHFFLDLLVSSESGVVALTVSLSLAWWALQVGISCSGGVDFDG